MRVLLLLLPLLLLPALAPTASAATLICSANPGAAPSGAVPLAVWAARVADYTACSVAQETCYFAWDQVFGSPNCLVGFRYDDPWP